MQKKKSVQVGLTVLLAIAAGFALRSYTAPSVVHAASDELPPIFKVGSAVSGVAVPLPAGMTLVDKIQIDAVQGHWIHGSYFVDGFNLGSAWFSVDASLGPWVSK